MIILIFLTGITEQDYCFDNVASEFGIDVKILIAISQIESNGNPWAISYNDNGSYDYCHMQINTFWYKSLGPEKWQYLIEPCYCTWIGAWVLAQCIERYGFEGYGYWDAICCYNTGKSISELSGGKLDLGIEYVNKVFKKYGELK
ncbi:MAG: lytic transglycosylase domain-containing protein [bacterium]|nr:lytic transglycosylase domain-containing protein [bacterium]